MAMTDLLKPRPASRPAGRGELVRQLAAMDETEFREIADESRGHSLISLGELVLEGLAVDIGSLANRLGDDVVIDDIGRQCCTRATARGLFTARAEWIAQQKAENKRRAEEFAESRARRRAEQEARERDAKRAGGRYVPPPPPDWEPTPVFSRQPPTPGFSRRP